MVNEINVNNDYFRNLVNEANINSIIGKLAYGWQEIPLQGPPARATYFGKITSVNIIHLNFNIQHDMNPDQSLTSIRFVKVTINLNERDKEYIASLNMEYPLLTTDGYNKLSDVKYLTEPEKTEGAGGGESRRRRRRRRQTRRKSKKGKSRRKQQRR